MLSIIQQFLLECLRLFGKMAPYLTLGFVLAGLLHVFIPKHVVARQLGKNNTSSVIKAAVVGVPLPLCSCGVVPTGIGLMKRGASRAATVSFLISTPQTGLDSIMVTYGFFGWVFAVFRPVAAFISGIVGGIATTFLDTSAADEAHWMKYHVSSEDALEDANGSRTFSQKLLDGARFSFVELLGDIALWLLIGLAVAAIISMAVPDDFFAGNLPNRFTQMLVMMAFGIPLYVCSTASIPIAAVLMTKGISAGAAFVFLMTGPATNAATIMILGRVLGRRVLAVYLGSIAVLALLFGFGLDAFVGALGMNMDHVMDHSHEMLSPWITWGTAGLLTFFMTLHFYNSAIRRYSKMSKTNSLDHGAIDLVVEGMTCSHCVRTVTQSLQNVSGVTTVNVTLENGNAHIEGEKLDRETLAHAVEDVGYSVKKS